MRWQDLFRRHEPDPTATDPELRKLAEEVRAVRLKTLRNKRDIQQIAAQAGLQDIDWWESRYDLG
jgi:hypothetical protein